MLQISPIVVVSLLLALIIQSLAQNPSLPDCMPNPDLYATLKQPPPKGVTCGRQGVRNDTDPSVSSCSTYYVEDCAQSCYDLKGCLSFQFDDDRRNVFYYSKNCFKEGPNNIRRQIVMDPSFEAPTKAQSPWTIEAPWTIVNGPKRAFDQQRYLSYQGSRPASVTQVVRNPFTDTGASFEIAFAIGQSVNAGLNTYSAIISIGDVVIDANEPLCRDPISCRDPRGDLRWVTIRGNSSLDTGPAKNLLLNITYMGPSGGQVPPGPAVLDIFLIYLRRAVT